MSRFTGFLIGFAFLVILCAMLSYTVDAQTTGFNVQHDGAAQFCAPGLQISGSTYNFTGNCSTPPPPDPDSYSTLSVQWVGECSGNRCPHVVDVTQFANVFGRINFQTAINPYWPGVSGTNIEYSDATTKYVRLHAHLPANPGTTPHKLKGTSYGHAPWALTARMAVVSPGAPWPTGADSACYKSVVHFDDQSGITVTPVPSANASYCYIGGDFDYLIDLNGTGGTASWTMN